jgi:tetratricopeptide (TPR) repeat protein
MKKLYVNLFLILFVAVPLFGQQTAADFYKAGNEQIMKGELDAAVNSYSECIKINPNAPGCFQNRAFALLEKSKREPRSTDSYTEYDGVKVLNKTRQRALEDINKALQLDPKVGTAYFVRGTLFGLEDINDRAYEDFRQGLTLAPNNASAKNELPKLEKKYASSLATRGRDAATRASYLAQAKDEAGAAKVKQQAIDFFTKSIELDKTNHLTWASRGDVYRYLKNYDAAIADYTEALRLKPDYLDAYVYRADAYAAQNKSALALADYEKVIATPVNDTNNFQINNAFLGRGKFHLDAGRTDAAIADFDKIIAGNPDYVMAFFYRGQAHAKKKNKPLAIADFRKALEIAPDYGEAVAELKKLGVQP